MSSQDPNGNKRKGVHFAEEPEKQQKRPAALPVEDEPSHRRHKRPRQRPNEDELDDIDEFTPGDDDEEGESIIPSEHELLKAKRERRLQREPGDEDDGDNGTHIDNRTSLAAEGISIEPFHMKEEGTDGTGYFDGDTYVFRKRQADEEPDAWLESLGEGEEESQQAIITETASREDRSGNDMDQWDTPELYAAILPLVSDTETVQQALIRYGRLLPTRSKTASTVNTEAPATKRAQQALNDLTQASNALLLKGKVEIYEMTRNDILQLLPDSTTAAVEAVEWEYEGSQDSQIHGPYTTAQMQGWIQAGYFVGPSAVRVRTVKSSRDNVDAPTKPSLQDDLLADLMEGDDNDKEEDGVDDTTKKPLAAQKVRGEWRMSDQVDFSQYT